MSVSISVRMAAHMNRNSIQLNIFELFVYFLLIYFCNTQRPEKVLLPNVNPTLLLPLCRQIYEDESIITFIDG
jgi:hypothetical protein